jgi:hypothetical protein
MKIICLKDIPQDQLKAFIAKMDGYHGISLQEKSWVYNQESKPYKLTLFCYLISQGNLIVEGQKLVSKVDGYSYLIDFITEYFNGKSIVSFTDLFFLDDLNEAFCSGKWYNVHESWLRDREDYLEILESRKPQVFRQPTAYAVVVDNGVDFYDMMQYVYRGKSKTVIIDFLGDRIKWEKVDYTSNQFKKDFNLSDARVTFSQITLQEWQCRYVEFFGGEVLVN